MNNNVRLCHTNTLLPCYTTNKSMNHWCNAKQQMHYLCGLEMNFSCFVKRQWMHSDNTNTHRVLLLRR